MPVLPRQDDDILVAATSTSAPSSDDPIDPMAQIYGVHDGLTSAQIGAIVGSIFGFAALVLIILCCVVIQRRRRYYYYSHYRHHHHHHHRHEHSSSDSSSTIDGSPPERPPPVRVRATMTERERVRIPGGPRYPTYRAIPIPNPRKPKVRHNV
ncbi:hypothetical protein ACO1O0_002646 [Amphichorda felina]